MEEILPADKEEMKLVASKHAEVHPPGRSALSLWRKFASLWSVKHQTGDSNTPKEIGLAKSKWCETGRKDGVRTAKESSSLESGNRAGKNIGIGVSKKQKGRTLLRTQLPTCLLPTMRKKNKKTLEWLTLETVKSSKEE